MNKMKICDKCSKSMSEEDAKNILGYTESFCSYCKNKIASSPKTYFAVKGSDYSMEEVDNFPKVVIKSDLRYVYKAQCPHCKTRGIDWMEYETDAIDDFFTTEKLGLIQVCTCTNLKCKKKYRA